MINALLGINHNSDYLSVFANENREIVFSEIGQSNMEGRDGDEENPDYPFDSEIGSKSWNGSSLVTLSTLRGDAEKGSHANYFADELFNLTGYKMISAESASGGSGMGANSGSSASNNWSSTGNLRGTTETNTNGALNEIGTTNPIALWCQGERDAQEIDSSGGSYTKADALVNLNSILDWWFGLYPDSIFVISELGDDNTGSNTQGWQDIREIQNQVANERSNVYIGFTGAKNFWNEGKMYDTLHYNYLGYMDMGEGMASYISNL